MLESAEMTVRYDIQYRSGQQWQVEMLEVRGVLSEPLVCARKDLRSFMDNLSRTQSEQYI